MKVAYIIDQETADSGYLEKEKFLIPEIIEIFNRENEILLLPIGKGKPLDFGDGIDPKIVSKNTLALPFMSRGVLLMGIILFFRNPIRSLKLVWKICTKSGSFRVLLENFSVFLNGLTLSEVVGRNKVDHLHAADASLASTSAYIAASICGVSLSFTGNGSEIAKNNIFKQKCKVAKFVRITDEAGYRAAINIVGDSYNAEEKCKLMEYNKMDTTEMVNRLLELMK